MEINQRDKNWKRSKIANKDESSGKIASPECTILINKDRKKAFATTLNTKTLCACVKEGKKEWFPTQTEKRSDCLNCYEIIYRKTNKKIENLPNQPSLKYCLPFLGRGRATYNTSQVTNTIAVLWLLKGFLWTYLTLEEKNPSCC